MLVNAWANARSDLWCAPGGGVEPGQSLPANLIREVHEETGLTIAVSIQPGATALTRIFGQSSLASALVNDICPPFDAA